MALYELGDEGLELWETWSKQNTAKYEDSGPNSCAAKWATFKAAGNQGVSLGTLFHHAKTNGWPGFPDAPKLVWGSHQADGVNEAADDPHRLARLHLAKFQHDGAPTLRFYRGEWLGWSEGAYRPIADAELQAGLAGTIKTEFNRLNQIAVKLWEKSGGKDASGKPVDKPVARQVTRPLTSNATLAMQSMGVLRGKPEAPFWIGEPSPFNPPEVMPIRNALVNLPGVVTGDMVDPAKFVLAPTPRFFSTYALDFDFNLEAGPPVELFSFLTTVWSEDLASIDALQEWIGYCLTPDTRQQKIGMFIGPMRSGRGTIARLMGALVGRENVAGPRLSALGTNFGLEPLVGKPLAIVGDARLSRRTDTGAIVEALLSISGEDTITIDRKHKAPWTGKLPTRLMLLSNELPRLPDQVERPRKSRRLCLAAFIPSRSLGKGTWGSTRGLRLSCPASSCGQSTDGNGSANEAISCNPSPGALLSTKCATSRARSALSSEIASRSRLAPRPTLPTCSQSGADGAMRRKASPAMS